VKHLASSYIPFVTKDLYESKEDPYEDEDGLNEAYTNKSTMGGNFFNYPLPLST
jgi:hypothetical protein